MKLKRFEQFINEAKINESTVSATVEENAFLVDGNVYIIGEVGLEVGVDYEQPDREVGIYGGHYADDWSIEGIDSVYKVTDPDIAQKIEQIKQEEQELGSMGFSGDAQRQILDLVFDADSEEVTGPELAALEKRILELDKAGQLVDLTGDFEQRCNDAAENAMEDYEPDEPDYDDDRW